MRKILVSVPLVSRGFEISDAASFFPRFFFVEEEKVQHGKPTHKRNDGTGTVLPSSSSFLRKGTVLPNPRLIELVKVD
jgi:hypothetical protein